MRRLLHVLWRGAMALSLIIAGGLGSGYGLYEAPVCSGKSLETCPESAIAEEVADTQAKRVSRSSTRVLLLRG
ncbi:MAG: hypothetical protein LH470_07800 [Lysobacter sp.]|nr:hypothetical protein [Lysobacter sp.]